MALLTQGIILAAGRGERLRPATGGTPKPLVELAGEPLLVRQARLMLEAGIERLVAIVNTQTAELMRRNGLVLPRRTEILVRDTASSLESFLAASERLAPGGFVGATVDAVVEGAEMARFVHEASALIGEPTAPRVFGVLGVTKWRGERRPLFVALDRTGLRVSRIGEASGDYVTAGLYSFFTDVLRLRLAAQRARLAALREFLAFMVESGRPIAAVKLRDVIDVDEDADLAEARARFAADGRSPESPAAGKPETQ